MERRWFMGGALAALGLATKAIPQTVALPSPASAPDVGFRIVCVDSAGGFDFPRPEWSAERRDLSWRFDEQDVGKWVVGFAVRRPDGGMLPIKIMAGMDERFHVEIPGDGLSLGIADATLYGATVTMEEVAIATANDHTFRPASYRITKELENALASMKPPTAELLRQRMGKKTA